MKTLWVDLKKTRAKLALNFSEVKQFEAFDKEQPGLIEYINKDHLWNQLHRKLKEQSEYSRDEVINLIEEALK